MTRESSVLATLGSARSVLVLADGLSQTRTGACGKLLEHESPERLHTIAVTYNRSAEAWLDRAQGVVGGEFGSVRIVDTGGSPAGNGSVVAQSPDDLTGIEIAITDSLPQDGTVVLCFDSLTALLQYVSVERAYRFLHALVERLWTEGVYAHFHMDPAAHEPETVVTFASLFDAVVASDAGLTPAGIDDTVLVDDAELFVSRRPQFAPEGNA